jgi:hypothetical protein
MGVTPVIFAAGETGEWTIDRILAVAGEPLAPAARLARIEGAVTAPPRARWVLRGTRSNERYTTRPERDELRRVQPELGRAASTEAVLIPISKSDAWWDLPQDERRAIFEARSGHVTKGLGALPAVARRLYHGRDLGAEFDFLTWFEFAPEERARFDDLVGELRRTEEWRYVVREVELRLRRDP